MLLVICTSKRRGALCAAVIALVAGCASGEIARSAADAKGESAPATTSAAPPASPQASPPPPASAPGAAEPTGTTALTGAVISSKENQGWTDDRILAVLVAANDADLEQADLAVERARDVRVRRLAEHLAGDVRILGGKARDLAERIGKTDTPERLEIDVEHGGYLVAMRDAPPEKFDAAYLRAQIEETQSLLRLIDDDLLASAKDPAVAALVREIRAGAAYHLATARSIQVTSAQSR